MGIERDFIFDPSLVLYLPLYKLDGASFMSRDAYGHLCTVTGAIWTPRGRSFDGLDDVISCPDHARLSFGDGATDSPFTIIAAGVEIVAGSYNSFLAKEIQGGTREWHFYTADTDVFAMAIFDEDSTKFIGRTGSTLSAATRYHVAVTYSGSGAASGVKLYLNGVQDDTADLVNGTYVAMHDSAAPVTVGKGPGSGPAWLQGYIGEVLIYNRVLSPLEIQHNYLATKWRYR